MRDLTGIRISPVGLIMNTFLKRGGGEVLRKGEREGREGKQKEREKIPSPKEYQPLGRR